MDIFVKKKCPKMKNPDILPTIVFHPYHILILWSGHQKNNSKFVMINFFVKT
jgi:hypothetical protein